MRRNLDRRVEILFPVQDKGVVDRLRDEILDVYMRDNLKARVMQPDGEYAHVWPSDGDEPLESQAWFLQHAAERAARAAQRTDRRGANGR